MLLISNLLMVLMLIMLYAFSLSVVSLLAQRFWSAAGLGLVALLTGTSLIYIVLNMAAILASTITLTGVMA